MSRLFVYHAPHLKPLSEQHCSCSTTGAAQRAHQTCAAPTVEHRWCSTVDGCRWWLQRRSPHLRSASQTCMPQRTHFLVAGRQRQWLHSVAGSKRHPPVIPKALHPGTLRHPGADTRKPPLQHLASLYGNLFTSDTIPMLLEALRATTGPSCFARRLKKEDETTTCSERYLGKHENGLERLAPKSAHNL